MGYVFISHASEDKGVVQAIREALAGHDLQGWEDVRELVGGDRLDDAIKGAIEEAEHFIVVLSVPAMGSTGVRKEIEHALEVEKRKPDYRVVPVLLPPVIPAWLPWLFEEDRQPIPIEGQSVIEAAVAAAMPGLLAALGLRRPSAPAAQAQRPAPPVADLVLTLEELGIERAEDRHQATARARLDFIPADGSPPVSGRAFRFTAPLGPIEAEDLAWYLERYWRWPSGVFRERARGIEAALPAWGQALYQASVGMNAARAPLAAWQQAATSRGVARRFTVHVDPDPIEGSSQDQTRDAAEAATLLLGLPWELMHDGRAHVFQGASGARVRRRLPNREQRATLVAEPPLRVLLVSPRPEEAGVGYLDHRASALPVFEAAEALGALVTVDILTPPTFPALQERLARADERGTPYHIVHFDGHGVFDRRHGLGALCFEDARDAGEPERRRSELVDAGRLGDLVHQRRVPLVYLDACQTAMADHDPTASVATRLLDRGVASVVAMSHNVLVETATRFLKPFYGALLQDGARIGEAMLAGQRALWADDYRGPAFDGELRLADWFVPVLFQEDGGDSDPRLVRRVPAEDVRADHAARRQHHLGEMPAAPAHGFVGRSRELLAAERVLMSDPASGPAHVVLCGQAGEGKTTLAAELARWLVRTGRFARAAFVSLEAYLDARAVMFAIGSQLVPGLVSLAGQDRKRAEQEIERALRERATVLVVDNVESVLPPAAGSAAASAAGAADAAHAPEVLDALLVQLARWAAVGQTRLVFTSRTPLPAPFAGRHRKIGRLARNEAVALVGQVLRERGQVPRAGDEGTDEGEIDALVDTVECHARSLVLLAHEVAVRGVRASIERLGEIMREIDARHPGSDIDNRERSLLASVRLSLDRLPADVRARIRPLAVLQGGGNLALIATMLGLELEESEALAQALMQVGLAELLPFGYLRLHPGVPAALDAELDDEARGAAREQWAQAVRDLVAFLYQQWHKDTQMAQTLVVLELANVLASLEHLRDHLPAADMVGLATRVEGLLSTVGQPRPLVQVAAVRAEAAAQLDEWSHARFIAEHAAISQLAAVGRVAEAVQAADAHLTRARAVSPDTFAEAAYDPALASFLLGRMLRKNGNPSTALAHLDNARRGFEALDGEDAARMDALCITECANCLLALGRLDEAADAYQTAIDLDEARGDRRSAAVGKGQLGTVRMHQGRYSDALAAQHKAQATFQSLDEPGAVATAWHQIGMVHRKAGQHDPAEHALQESLKLRVQHRIQSGEADTLGELGNLYQAMERHTEAVRFFRQAAAIYADLGGLANEGRVQSNAAISLIQLARHGEARQAIDRAIVCKAPFGHAVEPWTTFNILCDLERAAGNLEAAARARGQAIDAYLAYRRDGGENHSGHGRLCAHAAQLLTQGQTDELAETLEALRESPGLQDEQDLALLDALQAICTGSRDPALANAPALHYSSVAELRLLLESLPPPA